MSETPERSIHDGTSDERLANDAWKLSNSDNTRVMAAHIEMTRRLMSELRTFNRSSERWARAIAWLTVALVVFTIALVAIELSRH